MKRLKKSQVLQYKKKLVQEQGGKCAICEIDLYNLPSRDICLDHDHIHGHVRSALCRNCNGLEGKIYNLANRGKRGKTPKDFLIRVIKYWNTHQDPDNPVYHPDHKTDEEKRLLRNKRARLKRAQESAKRNIKVL